MRRCCYTLYYAMDFPLSMPVSLAWLLWCSACIPGQRTVNFCLVHWWCDDHCVVCQIHEMSDVIPKFLTSIKCWRFILLVTRLLAIFSVMPSSNARGHVAAAYQMTAKCLSLYYNIHDHVAQCCLYEFLISTKQHGKLLGWIHVKWCQLSIISPPTVQKTWFIVKICAEIRTK